MSFSEKMRDSLGAEGAKVEVEAPDTPINVGGVASAKVLIHGGTQAAQIEALVMRVIEAKRHWVESGGNTMSEEQAQALPDRGHLMPAWTRETVSETRVDVGQVVESGQTHEVAVTLPVPENCGSTSPSVAVTINAQADIKGQIDPTGNGRITVA
jgi:sporulation-control protein spo0M